MDTERITNEFHETITKDKLAAIAKRVRALPDATIDELWFSVGFIYSEKGSNKAISQKEIKQLKKSEANAEMFVAHLFQETKVNDIEKELRKLETKLHNGQ
jgi:predicted S18 family serine protease